MRSCHFPFDLNQFAPKNTIIAITNTAIQSPAAIAATSACVPAIIALTAVTVALAAALIVIAVAFAVDFAACAIFCEAFTVARAVFCAVLEASFSANLIVFCSAEVADCFIVFSDFSRALIAEFVF